MKSLLMLWFVTVAGVTGCWLFDEDDNYLVHPLRTLDLDVVEVSSHGVTFTFHSQLPDPCYEHYRTHIEHRDAEVLVTVYARRDGSLICPCVVEDISWPIDVSVPSVGTYLFRFWETDSTTVDTTLYVP